MPDPYSDPFAQNPYLLGDTNLSSDSNPPPAPFVFQDAAPLPGFNRADLSSGLPPGFGGGTGALHDPSLPPARGDRPLGQPLGGDPESVWHDAMLGIGNSRPLGLPPDGDWQAYHPGDYPVGVSPHNDSLGPVTPGGASPSSVFTGGDSVTSWTDTSPEPMPSFMTNPAGDIHLDPDSPIPPPAPSSFHNTTALPRPDSTANATPQAVPTPKTNPTAGVGPALKTPSSATVPPTPGTGPTTAATPAPQVGSAPKKTHPPGPYSQEIPPSNFDRETFNSIYDNSDTARALYNYARSKGFDLYTLPPGGVEKQTRQKASPTRTRHQYAASLWTPWATSLPAASSTGRMQQLPSMRWSTLFNLVSVRMRGTAPKSSLLNSGK